jgi:mannose/cellobiose epimerase-like protein (N-acyl-D-glucosamine 2-epimerase family)
MTLPRWCGAPSARKALWGPHSFMIAAVIFLEQLTSSDFGVSTGLISQGYWEQSKWYFVNVERGNIADKLQPRNINVSFTNNSNVPIEL